jgi:uncharacterized membrane protein YgdD (TMEM256/DUF423 family)
MKKNNMQKSMLIAASSLMAIAVILGALGAHALTMVLNQMQLSSFETGVRYQAWHALAIILVQLIPANYMSDRARKTISILFLLGIVCFSFSIYLLNLRYLLNIESLAKFLGPVTPVGGLLFIAGWIVLCISLIRTKSVI